MASQEGVIREAITDGFRIALYAVETVGAHNNIIETFDVRVTNLETGVVSCHTEDCYSKAEARFRALRAEPNPEPAPAPPHPYENNPLFGRF